MKKKYLCFIGFFLLSVHGVFGSIIWPVYDSPQEGGNAIWVDNKTDYEFRLAIERREGVWIFGSYNSLSPLILNVSAKNNETYKTYPRYQKVAFAGSYIQFYEKKLRETFTYEIPEEGFPGPSYYDKLESSIMVNAYWYEEDDKKGWMVVVRQDDAGEEIEESEEVQEIKEDRSGDHYEL